MIDLLWVSRHLTIPSSREVNYPYNPWNRLISDCLPYTAITASSHFVLAAVPHGGHLGWFDGPLFGPDKHRRWHVRPVIEFLTGALNSLQYEMEPLTVKEAGGWKYAEGTGWMVVEDTYVHSGKAI